jgi:hypothetical protein
MRATLSTPRAKRGTMMKRVTVAGSITAVLLACACGTWASSARAADASADAGVDDAAALADSAPVDASSGDAGGANDDGGAGAVDTSDASSPASIVESKTGDTCAVSRGAGAGARSQLSSAPLVMAAAAVASLLAARRLRATASRTDRG